VKPAFQRDPVLLGPYTICEDEPVRFVAELGVNHLGDIGRMKEMIHSAVEAGADYLKFQTYLAEKRYDSKNNPKGREFTERLAKWQFSRDQEADLWSYAHRLGATVFTSVFDIESIDFAEAVGTVAYKIAAFEVVNLNLIRRVAEKGKPILLSRGMVSKKELDSAVNILRNANVPFIILHTISSYPLQKNDSHLRMIHTLRELYSCPIGHSDHTFGSEIPPLAVAAGARIIEKHFTVTPKSRDSDNFFSITPPDLEEIMFRIRQVERIMGRGDVVTTASEDYMRDFRRPSD
jgi:sialic acid synthase SpsE